MKNNNLIQKNQLNEWQLERLSILVYLDIVLQESKEITLADILKDFKTKELQAPLPCLMTSEEWNILLDSIQKDEQLCKLKIYEYEEIRENQEDVLKGHRVVCFVDEEKNAYIIFRGTSGDEEWEDNGNIMLQSDTIQQKAALKFVKRIKESLNPQSIITAGHSKGGNKAQYTAATAPENYAVSCVSIDGPGFSPEFIAKYSRNISLNKNILLLAEQRDYINCLGMSIGQTKYYRGFRSESSIYGKYGCPIKYFHCPDSLRDKNGNILKSMKDSAVSQVINEFTTYFLTNKRYEAEKEEVISHILTLLMTEKHCSNEELGFSVAKSAMVLFDMLSSLKGFSDKMYDLIFKEANMLVATIEDIFSPKKIMANQKSLKECIIEELVLCIFETPQSFKNFLKATSTLVLMVGKMLISTLHDKTILSYIVKAIISIIEYANKRPQVTSTMNNLQQQLITLSDRIAPADKVSDLYTVNEFDENLMDGIIGCLDDLIEDLDNSKAFVNNEIINTQEIDSEIKAASNPIITKYNSPNINVGRSGYKPDMIVCHIAEGSYSGAVNWLCNPDSKVSAHFVVSKKGEIAQLVDLKNTAWCNATSNVASNSRYYGKSNSENVRKRKVSANLYTISIEHEGKISEKNGDLTLEQKLATVELIKFINSEVKRIYGISISFDREHILGHCDVTPLWKPNCPGKMYPFDDVINRLKKD